MDYREKKYQVFELFNSRWGLCTAGSMEDFDGCTIGWGSLGNIWHGTDGTRRIVTVYINPIRYTADYMLKNEYFTVSFFPEQYREDLRILGTKSARDVDKFALTSLTPYPVEHSVAFKEASLTFVCRKIYWNQFVKSKMSPDAAEIYDRPNFPPHYEFIGDIIDVIDKEG